MVDLSPSDIDHFFVLEQPKSSQSLEVVSLKTISVILQELLPPNLNT